MTDLMTRRLQFEECIRLTDHGIELEWEMV